MLILAHAPSFARKLSILHAELLFGACKFCAAYARADHQRTRMLRTHIEHDGVVTSLQPLGLWAACARYVQRIWLRVTAYMCDCDQPIHMHITTANARTAVWNWYTRTGVSVR